MRKVVTDSPGTEPPDDDESEFQDDALSELMAGAYVATSMVSISAPPSSEIPELPQWEPSEDALPTAEVLDEESGDPVSIESGEFAAPLSENDDDDGDVDHDAPALVGSLLARTSDIPKTPSHDRVTRPDGGRVALVPKAPPAVPPGDAPNPDAVEESAPSEVEAGASLQVEPQAARPVPPLERAAVSGVVEVDVIQQAAAATTVPLDMPRKSSSSDEADPEPAASISAEPGVVVRTQRRPASELTGSYPTLSGPGQPNERRPTNPHPVLDEPRSRAVPIVLGLTVLASLAGGWFWFSNRSAPRGQGTAVAQAGTADNSSPNGAPASADEKSNALEATRQSANDPEVSRANYAAAAARYERDQAPDALVEMSIAACELRDGPTARSAFRKLVGTKLRSRTLVTCRELGVDVSALGNGYTAGELAQQAQAALDEAHYDEALKLAKKSNRVERNQAALVLIVKAHCRLAEVDQAKKMMRHVSEKRRAAVDAYCKDAGAQL